MKRQLILGLVVALVIASISPVSLCGMTSLPAGDCTPTGTETRCDQMDMGAPAGPNLEANTQSCCAISQAPVPEAKNTVPQSAPELAQAINPAVPAPANLAEPRFVDIRHDASPPPSQSLLCTFLL